MGKRTPEDQRKINALANRYSCGCLLAIILLPVIGLTAIFYIAGLYEQEWTDARPKGLTDAEWSAKRALCETADLSADECGTTPTARVTKLGEGLTERRRLALCSEDASFQARAEAEKTVEAHLKSPSSAKFVRSGIRTVQEGCDWTVTGEVDSQNSFGAMLRTSFRVKLQRVSDDVWLPLAVRID